MTEHNVDRFHVPQTQSVHLQETDDETDSVRIKVPLASTDVNRDGHKLTMDGLRDISDQLESGEVPLYMDHGLSKETGFREYTVEDMIGKWVDSEIDEDSGVVNGIAELEDSEKADTLIQKLEQELPVGFSIGFLPDRETAREMDDGGMKWNDVDLLETSAVGIPSDPNAVAAGAMIAQAFGEEGVEPDRINQVVQEMTDEETQQEDEEEFLELVREVVSDELDSHREMLKSDMEAMFEEYVAEEDGDEEGDDEEGDDESDEDSEEQSLEEIKAELRSEVKEEVRQDLLDDGLEVQDPEGTITTPDGEQEQSTDGDTANRWVEPKR